MKIVRWYINLFAAVVGLACPCTVWGQAGPSTTPSAPTPPVVLHSDSGPTAAAGLNNVPPAVSKLIQNFNALRDKYLLKQHILLETLQNATTPEQREAIREQLQENRQGFLDQLSDFRSQLKDELKNMQGRISNAEFLRIIDSAGGGSSTTGGDHHHRGN